MLNLCHLEQSDNFPHPGSLKIWQQKIIIWPREKMYFGSPIILYKINFWKKCHFLPKKCIFLDKNVNLPPSHQVNLTELHISKDNWFTIIMPFQWEKNEIYILRKSHFHQIQPIQSIIIVGSWGSDQTFKPQNTVGCVVHWSRKLGPLRCGPQ